MYKIFQNKRRGFTLIELLVVIAIIGILSSIVIASLNSARVKARDTQRRESLRQYLAAAEMSYSDSNSYPVSAGWLDNSNGSSLIASLSPYVKININYPTDIYMYWRKDYVGYTCLTNISSMKIAFYAKLENPTSQDLATITSGDSFDQCVASTWGMNYKVGN